MHHQAIFIAIFLIYIVIVTAVMIALGIPTYPDSYFFVLIIPVLFIHRTRRFILDWVPFLLLFLAYEFLRGLAGVLKPRANYELGIQLDKWLGGTPTFTNLVQSHLYQIGKLHFYDYLVTIVYFLHFVAPLTFAFLLWMKNRQQFLRFTWAFLLLSYAGLVTFIIFPTAPPWLAAQNGLIPHVYKILEVTLSSFPDHLSLPTIYQNFNPNQVAAIPSLHAAFPTLIFLYTVRFFGRRALPVIIYPALVWFSIIYLGEHYLSDALIGALYAVASFIVVEKAFASPKLKNWLKDKWPFWFKKEVIVKN